MKRLSLAAAVVVFAFAALSPAGPAEAGEHVPFDGRLDADVVVTPLAPPIFLVEIEGRGAATHLGRFAVSIPHLVDRSARTAAGTYEFVAANGDTVTAEFTGVSAPTDVPNVLHIVETATIAGGTGRFAGATGGFVCHRWYDTANGTTGGSFDGTISTGGTGE